ncbi:succinyl-CoA synthetase, beta subunit [Methanococcus vannielii SB]|uniref:Succinyl-CoA synthetase, beta subunit n=1 Tax=Methanococcus vannielii (strain ATCC 35089 / DSM 1224 / JCM 13029 / OCM 148 / SB) TaxID=406327 RepID=A6UPB6_METVS|nr:ADP-forming succinate--CoA ligase subunit beta [Methanococcus vannielii]ABR54338.1 succinyl-CoA synthetase, beta subunit [Methanococcus vannielii SB]
MKLHEYEAKRIFNENGIPIPKGIVTKTKLEDIEGPVVIKAQVLVGGRGKAGGILFADTLNEANSKIESLIGKEVKGEHVESLLIEEKIKILKEYYVGVVVDRNEKNNVVIFSTEGGVDIEEIARTSPEKIIKYPVEAGSEFLPYNARNMLKKAGLSSEEIPKVADIICKVYSAFKKMDGVLAEVNPLVITSEGKILAADAVLNVDDDAYFKHSYMEFEEFKKQEKSEFAYVELDGDIAVIGNGAGLTLASMDVVKEFGGNPACFLDIGGGATREIVKSALLKATARNSVKGAFINILGGITRCDEVSKGIVDVLKEKPELKFAVRMMGTNEKEGREILTKNNVSYENSMEDAAKALTKIINN